MGLYGTQASYAAPTAVYGPGQYKPPEPAPPPPPPPPSTSQPQQSQGQQHQMGGKGQDTSFKDLPQPPTASFPSPTTSTSTSSSSETVSISEFRALSERLALTEAKNVELTKKLEEKTKTDGVVGAGGAESAERMKQLQDELNVAILEISRLTTVTENFEQMLQDQFAHQQEDTAAEVKALESELENLRNSNKSILQNLESANTTIQHLKEENEQLTSSVNTLTSDLSRATVKADADAERCKRLEADLATAHERQSKLEAQITSQTGTAQHVLEDIEKRLRETEQMRDQLEAENASHRANLAAAQVEIERLTKHNEEFEAHSIEAE
ncbi:hypothetical protein HK102_011436, partial [Quaeritorhiza haematococci]